MTVDFRKQKLNRKDIEKFRTEYIDEIKKFRSSLVKMKTKINRLLEETNNDPSRQSEFIDYIRIDNIIDQIIINVDKLIKLIVEVSHER